MNGYLRASWPRMEEVGGIALHPDWWSRPYEYAWALDHLDKLSVALNRPLRVLDVGCGPWQPFVDAVVLRGHQLHAVDVDPEAIFSVRERFVRRGFMADLRVDAAQTVGVAGFDIVTCLSVVEHDPDWKGAIANLVRARRLLLTFDVMDPITSPHQVIDVALQAGATVVGPVDFRPHEDRVNFGSWLRVFAIACEHTS